VLGFCQSKNIFYHKKRNDNECIQKFNLFINGKVAKSSNPFSCKPCRAPLNSLANLKNR